MDHAPATVPFDAAAFNNRLAALERRGRLADPGAMAIATTIGIAGAQIDDHAQRTSDTIWLGALMIAVSVIVVGVAITRDRWAQHDDLCDHLRMLAASASR